MALVISSIISQAQVKIYRQFPTSEFPVSTTYKVEVRQGNNPYQEVHVFKYKVPENNMVTKTENIAMFAFEPSSGAVDVRVSMKNGTNMTSSFIEVVNKTIAGLESSFSNGKMIITCPTAKEQILIRQKANYADQLVLFLDPLKESNIPANANVKVFTAAGSPHVQNARYDRYTVPNNVDIVYLEDGAVVKGTIHTDDGRSKPLKLMGRGIVIGNGGILNGSQSIPWNAIELKHGNGHTIEGITCISPRHFSIRVSNNSHVDNVKMFGYNANIDGIVAGNRALIENCYSKVNDDHIKLYNDDMVVRNCRFYMQKNGGLFQFAWNRITPGSDCLVENCEVLAWEANCGDPKLGQGGTARTVISLRETEARSTSGNNIFRNIYIQGQLDRFIGINGKYGGSDDVTLDNITVENVTIEKKPRKYSWIYTGSSPWKIVFNFKNVKIAGQCMTPSNYQFNTEGNVKLNYLGCGNSNDTQAPSIPGGLTINSVNQNSATVSWGASTDNVNVSAYEVFVDNSKLITVNGTSATLNNLDCNTSYTVKVRAKDLAGNLSDFSASKSFITSECAVGGPSDIEDLKATVTTCESVSLTWSDVENETGYRVRRKLASESAYTNIGDVAANVKTYTDFTAEENTSYVYMVRPLVDGSAVALSNLQEVLTPKCVVENKLPEVSLTAPSNNSAYEAPASIQLTVSASDADGSITKVEFFEGNNKLGMDNSAPYDFTWNNVSPGTYTITAKAWDNENAVSTSQSISITVTEPSISDIEDLQAVVENCETVTLTWSDVDHETGYRVRRKLPSESGYTNIGDVNANATTFTDMTAEESTTYIYMVRPLKDRTAVASSNLQEVTTTKCVITSLKDVNSFGSRVYPNPVSDYLIINTHGANWQLKNSTGSLILSGTEEKVNMTELPSGLYFLNLDGEIIKVVKK